MQQGNWIRAASVNDIEEDDVVGVKLGDVDVALYRMGGRYYASANRCTHQLARLSDGFVIDEFIECPLHQGRFHIPTGKPSGAPVSIPLKTYSTKVEMDEIYVLLDEELTAG